MFNVEFKPYCTVQDDLKRLKLKATKLKKAKQTRRIDGGAFKLMKCFYVK